MLNALLVAVVSCPELAVSVYPVPALSMLKSPKVAIPAAAATGIVPWSAPPDGLLPITSDTLPVNPVAVLPKASRAITLTAGIVAPACVALGCTVNASFAAAAGVIVAPAVVLPGGTVKTSWLPASATRKSGSLSALSPNATQALVPPPWSTARACQWYAVASLRPPTVALAVAPLATAAPEPLALPVNALPTASTSTSSRSGDPPGGPVTVAVNTTDRLVTEPPTATAVTPSLWNWANAEGGAGGGPLPATTKSTGTWAGLPTAWPADTTTVSWYTPGSSPAGFRCTCTRAGVVPVFGVTSSHPPPTFTLALHASAPAPLLVSAMLSTCMAVLPTAALSSTRPGATDNAASGGGSLVSLSILQVASRTVSKPIP